MKAVTFTFLFLSFLFSGNTAFTQETCKVLKPGIDSAYHGKCKKGLAHGKGKADGIDSYLGKFVDGLPDGKGTYTWANGDQYIGQWDQGRKNGEGTLTLKLNEKDSIVSGLWKDDNYLGPKPDNPKVINNVGVDRHTFKKISDAKDRVLVKILQNGMKNTGVSNFLMSGTTGVETMLGQDVGYDFVEFPITIKVSYITFNKMHTDQYPVHFEFKISEPGDWRVEIHN